MRPPLKTFAKVVLGSTLGLGAIWYGGGYAMYWWRDGRFLETTDNAYVRADVTLVASKIAGYVSSTEVEDNQPVQAGQVLFRIDDADYRARVEQARADVETRRAALNTAKSQEQIQTSVIAQMEAEVRSATADHERTRADLDRYTQLVTREVTSTQRFESAKADSAKATAALAASQARLVAERDRVELLASQEAGARAALDQARATLKLAEIDLANTVVRAAISGTVGNWQVRIGRYVQPGMQLLAIVPMADAYVVANYKETQLDHMKVGQRVEIEVDSYPGRTVFGRVSSLSPASGAQFALLPPDNATGNFTKVVQRIPVKITVDRDGELAGELRPGMSVITKVDTRGGARSLKTKPPDKPAGEDHAPKVSLR